jgi:hypothetical protein
MESMIRDLSRPTRIDVELKRRPVEVYVSIAIVCIALAVVLASGASLLTTRIAGLTAILIFAYWWNLRTFRLAFLAILGAILGWAYLAYQTQDLQVRLRRHDFYVSGEEVQSAAYATALGMAAGFGVECLLRIVSRFAPAHKKIFQVGAVSLFMGVAGIVLGIIGNAPILGGAILFAAALLSIPIADASRKR